MPLPPPFSGGVLNMQVSRVRWVREGPLDRVRGFNSPKLAAICSEVNYSLLLYFKRDKKGALDNAASAIPCPVFTTHSLKRAPSSSASFLSVRCLRPSCQGEQLRILQATLGNLLSGAEDFSRHTTSKKKNTETHIKLVLVPKKSGSGSVHHYREAE